MNRDIFTDEFGNTGALDDGDSKNNDSIDYGVFYDDIWELHADLADDGVLNPSNVIHNGGDVEYCDNSHFAACAGITFQRASADNTSFTSENTGVVCFCTGILIPHGEVPIELVIWSSLAITAFSPLSGLYRVNKTLMRLIHLSLMRGGKARVMQGCRKVRYAILRALHRYAAYKTDSFLIIEIRRNFKVAPLWSFRSNHVRRAALHCVSSLTELLHEA